MGDDPANLLIYRYKRYEQGIILIRRLGLKMRRGWFLMRTMRRRPRPPSRAPTSPVPAGPSWVGSTAVTTSKKTLTCNSERLRLSLGRELDSAEVWPALCSRCYCSMSRNGAQQNRSQRAIPNHVENKTSVDRWGCIQSPTLGKK